MPTPPAQALRPASATAPQRVAVLAFDRISPFHLCVPSIVLGEASPHFDVRVVAMESSPLRTTAGFQIATDWGLDMLALADVVIVPTWRDVHERAPEAVLQALRDAHARGAVLVGLCLGAFVLAQAGVLDARRATTHWACAAALAQQHPSVQVDASVLYVQDGTVLTSAGTAAALDCCLHLLRSTAGAAVANHAARMLVLAPHRSGGQAQFIECAVPPAAAAQRAHGPVARRLACRSCPHAHAGRRGPATAHEPAHLQPSVPRRHRHGLGAVAGAAAAGDHRRPAGLRGRPVRPGQRAEPALSVPQGAGADAAAMAAAVLCIKCL